MIHYYPGSGGFFLTAVFAKIMNIKVNPLINATGHCHDLGAGEWNETADIKFAHVFDRDTNDMKLQYHSGAQLSSTHAVTLEFINQHPEVEVVQIGADSTDYFSITKLYVKKAWRHHWTQDEYNKWVSPNYPPYSRNNIDDSDLICNDLINDFMITRTPKWFEQNAQLKYAHVINFKTLMGLDDKNLGQEVAKITGGQLTDKIRDFITEYQMINKRLYFIDNNLKTIHHE